MGGLPISKLEEAPRRSSVYTCPNSSCGRVFAKPIKVLNLQQPSQAPYDACPFCFTEISIDAEVQVTFDAPKDTVVEEEIPAAEHVEASIKPAGCSYYLGYLSDRSSKDKIPDECMMCKSIVECMLKKTR